jgi:4-hydroxybenzoate polyprenyltransferase
MNPGPVASAWVKVMTQRASRTLTTQTYWELAKEAKALWVTLRPRQWVKNLFVLTPLLFSQNLFVATATIKALAAFLCFCLSSSSIYIFNDIKDCQQDRLHPAKRWRPLAAGELKLGTAWTAMIALLLPGLGGAMTLGSPFAVTVFTYWIINVLYSVILKHWVILDVFALATGFVLRVVAGALVIDVEMSHWLLICAALLALFLGFSKRRYELVILGSEASNHRKVLSHYNPHFLDMMIGIVTACTVMSYALYTISEETVHKFHTERLLLTLPFVLYGIFRYLYLVYHKNEGGDPTESLLTDKASIINVFLWATTVAAILYYR